MDAIIKKWANLKTQFIKMAKQKGPELPSGAGAT